MAFALHRKAGWVYNMGPSSHSDTGDAMEGSQVCCWPELPYLPSMHGSKPIAVTLCSLSDIVQLHRLRSAAWVQAVALQRGGHYRLGTT